MGGFKAPEDIKLADGIDDKNRTDGRIFKNEAKKFL
jgi:hypothetical protein